MKFISQWFKFYWIKKIIVIKNIYLFKEFDGIPFDDTVSGNQIKCFYYQNFNLNSVLYTEEAAFPSLISSIERESTVPLNQSSLDLATLPV